MTEVPSLTTNPDVALWRCFCARNFGERSLREMPAERFMALPRCPNHGTQLCAVYEAKP